MPLVRWLHLFADFAVFTKGKKYDKMQYVADYHKNGGPYEIYYTRTGTEVFETK